MLDLSVILQNNPTFYTDIVNTYLNYLVPHKNAILTIYTNIIMGAHILFLEFWYYRVGNSYKEGCHISSQNQKIFLDLWIYIQIFDVVTIWYISNHTFKLKLKQK